MCSSAKVLINNKYTLEKLLGSGKFGEIYLAIYILKMGPIQWRSFLGVGLPTHASGTQSFISFENEEAVK